MGNSVFSALSMAADTPEEPDKMSELPDKNNSRHPTKTRHSQRTPHSAFEASCLWGDIDTTKVDVGRLAPRILAAQKPIPAREAQVIHSIRNAHDCYVRVLVWDPFRDYLISGGGDGWIRVWSTEDYRCLGELDAQLSVRALLVLTNELASGHSNGEVFIWGMDSREFAKSQALKPHREAVYALVMLPTGELVTGAEDIRIFARNTISGFYLVKVVSEEVLCMCTVPRHGSLQGTVVVTGDMNSLITVWDTANNWKVAATCQGHTRSVWSVCYVRDAQLFASGSADQTIRIWNPVTWECERVLKDHSGWVVGLSCGPRWLLSCSIDQTVRVWDVRQWTCERAFTDQKYEVYCVCAFAGGRLVTGGAEMSVIIYGGPEQGCTGKSHLGRAVGKEPGWQTSPGGELRDEQEHDKNRLGENLSSWVPSLNPPAQRTSAPASTMPASNRVSFVANASSSTGGSKSPRERRSQLIARSEIDMTMGDFRDQIRKELNQIEDDLEPCAPTGADYESEFQSRLNQMKPSKDQAGVPHSPSFGGCGESSVSQKPRSQQAAQPQPPPHQPEDPADLEFETRRHVQVPSLEELMKQKKQYQVGDEVQCFSTSQNKWITARVSKIENKTVTVEYPMADGSGAMKTLPADHEHLRPLATTKKPEAPAGNTGGVTDWSSALLQRGRHSST